MLLVVFFVVNVSLVVIKLRKDPVEEAFVSVPLFVPVVGALLTVVLALAVKPKALWSFRDPRAGGHRALPALPGRALVPFTERSGRALSRGRSSRSDRYWEGVEGSRERT